MRFQLKSRVDIDNRNKKIRNSVRQIAPNLNPDPSLKLKEKSKFLRKSTENMIPVEALPVHPPTQAVRHLPPPTTVHLHHPVVPVPHRIRRVSQVAEEDTPVKNTSNSIKKITQIPKNNLTIPQIQIINDKNPFKSRLKDDPTIIQASIKNATKTLQAQRKLRLLN